MCFILMFLINIKFPICINIHFNRISFSKNILLYRSETAALFLRGSLSEIHVLNNNFKMHITIKIVFSIIDYMFFNCFKMIWFLQTQVIKVCFTSIYVTDVKLKGIHSFFVLWFFGRDTMFLIMQFKYYNYIVWICSPKLNKLKIK